MPTLVVIVGSIASGKSTIATGLAERFRARDRRVALLDLDELVETIGGFVGLSLEQLRQAQMVFGQLVGAWLVQDFDVIAHGPFFDHDEDQALLHAIPDGVVVRRVLLHTTLAVALEQLADLLVGDGDDPGTRASPSPGGGRRGRRRRRSVRHLGSIHASGTLRKPASIV